MWWLESGAVTRDLRPFQLFGNDLVLLRNLYYRPFFQGFIKKKAPHKDEVLLFLL
jgi:hypothetical protein